MERRLLIAVLAMGVVLRVHEFVVQRAFRRDEVMLFLNIQSRTWLELTQPLADNQGAPLLFLWIQKLVLLTIGGTEAAMRLWPFLAGTAALFFFAAWIFRKCDPFAGLTALAVFAIGQHPIFYSTDAKQYSTDLLVAILLLWGMDQLRSASPRRPLFWLLSLGGAAAVWLSHPSVFVIAGIGTALLAGAARARDRESFFRIGSFCAIAAASFIAEYVALLRELASNQFLLEWWEFAFMPFPPQSWHEAGWFLARFSTLMRSYTTSLSLNVAMLLFVMGAASLYRRDRQYFWVLLLPFAVTLLASAAHFYPIHNRLMQFLYPSIALLVGEGASAVAAAGKNWRRPILAGGTGLLLLFAPPLVYSAQMLFTSERAAEIRPVLAYIQSHRKPGDCLFLHAKVQRQFQYYARQYDLDSGGCVAVFHEWITDGQLEHVSSGRPRRIWLLYAQSAEDPWDHESNPNPPPPNQELDRLVGQGSAVFLYSIAEQ